MRLFESHIVAGHTRLRLRHRLQHVWASTGIQTKILLLLFLLLSLSLLGTSIGFVLSTRATRDRILDRQLDEDRERLISALQHRSADALEADRLLSHVLIDPMLTERSIPGLNRSLQMVDVVVPVRERFGLDQVIVLDTSQQMRVNIAPSHLESLSVLRQDLLAPCSDIEQYVVQYQTRGLFISCAPIVADGMPGLREGVLGHVYTVLDMPELLKRIRRDLELVTEPRFTTYAAATSHVPPVDDPSHVRSRTLPVVMGNNTIDLTLTVQTRDINQIVHSGLRVMLVSSAIAIALSVAIAALTISHILTIPLIRLNAVAEKVASGDLSARAPITSRDEIGRLATTFNGTTAQLQELVTELEQRVEQRTAELTATNQYLQQEIMERRRAEERIQCQQEELERLATTDELTGLYNRRHFFKLAEHPIIYARTSVDLLSAVMLDLDHFKKINDTYGHVCGDQVLRVVAQRCRNNLRDTDIVGRYGGEEFAILLPHTSVQTALVIAERLRHDICSTPITTERGTLSVTVSVGIAAAAHEYLDLTNLLDHADAALYTAKRMGRNRVVVADHMPLLPWQQELNDEP